MSESRDCVVAVDIGGTTLKGAAFDRDGHVLAARTLPTFGVNGRATDSVSDLVGQLLDLMRGQARAPRLLTSVLGPRAGLTGAGLCGWARLAAPGQANGPAGLAAAGPGGSRAGAPAGFSRTALAGLAAATAPPGAAHA